MKTGGCEPPEDIDFYAARPLAYVIGLQVRLLENSWACKRLMGSNPTPAVRSKPKPALLCAFRVLEERDRTSAQDRLKSQGRGAHWRATGAHKHVS